MPCVYILYSPTKDLFYTGATTIAAEKRLERHTEKYYANKFTSKIADRELFLTIECISMKQAMLIERHIKRMKSKKYIADLKKFPSIFEKLKLKYSAPDS